MYKASVSVYDNSNPDEHKFPRVFNQDMIKHSASDWLTTNTKHLT